MKKNLIVSLVVLALIVVPVTARASVFDDLMKVIISLQQQIIALLTQRSQVATTTPIGGGVACTMEAKQCPDGSYVGRTGSKCEFKACPLTTNKIVFATGFTVDNFLIKNNTLSLSNVGFIKKITGYKNKIVAFGDNYASIRIVNDGTNENIIYFNSEGESLTDLKSATVYKLNLKTNELETVYSPSQSHFYFHLIARQDSKLLFEKIDQMDSPGPCFDIWAYAYKNPLPRAEGMYPNQQDSRTIKALDLVNPV